MYHHHVTSQKEVDLSSFYMPGREILLKLNENVKRCQQWMEFSCGGFIHQYQHNWVEGQLGVSSELRQLIHNAEYRIYRILRSNEPMGNTKETVDVLRAARSMYSSCLNTAASSDDQHVEDVMNVLQKIVDNPARNSNVFGRSDTLVQQLQGFWVNRFPTIIKLESLTHGTLSFSCSKAWLALDLRKLMTSSSDLLLCVELLKPILQLEVNSRGSNMTSILDDYLQTLRPFKLISSLRNNLTAIMNFHDALSMEIRGFHSINHSHESFEDFRANYPDTDSFMTFLWYMVQEGRSEQLRFRNYSSSNPRLYSDQFQLLHNIYRFLSKYEPETAVKQYFILDAFLRAQMILPRQSSSFKDLKHIMEKDYLHDLYDTIETPFSGENNLFGSQPTRAYQHICTRLVSMQFETFAPLWQKQWLKKRLQEGKNSSEEKLLISSQILKDVRNALELKIFHTQSMDADFKLTMKNLLKSVSYVWRNSLRFEQQIPVEAEMRVVCLPSTISCRNASLIHCLFNPVTMSCPLWMYQQFRAHKMYGSDEEFRRIQELLANALLIEDFIETKAPKAVNYARLGYFFALDFSSRLDYVINSRHGTLSRSEATYLYKRMCFVRKLTTNPLGNEDPVWNSSVTRDYYANLYISNYIAIEAAFDAYVTTDSDKATRNLFRGSTSMYTGEQLFFITLSQLWCTTTETQLNSNGSLLNDPHHTSPSRSQILAHKFLNLFPPSQNIFHCGNAADKGSGVHTFSADSCKVW